MRILWSGLAMLALLALSSWAGFFANSRLPERHRSPDSMAVVQLANTLLVTFIAIVLGLLTTSVKSGFDQAYAARGNYAGQLAQLDRRLRDYGPEAAPIRDELRSYVAAVIASTWPDEPPPKDVSYPDTAKMALTGENIVLAELMNRIGLETRSLEPKDQVHRNLMAACVEEYHDVTNVLWAVIEGVRSSISTPFYWVLVFWLMILFASFGLRAAPTPMILAVIGLSAVAVTTAVLVILDMNEPYGGLFGIPSDSMRNALADTPKNFRNAFARRARSLGAAPISDGWRGSVSV